MSEIITKIGVGILASAAVAAGVLTTYTSITPSTFGDVLSKENLKLLEDSSDKWEKLVKKHEKKVKQTDKTFDHPTISDLNLESDSEQKEQKEQKLRSKCHELWNKDLNGITDNSEKERIKKELRNWCVQNPSVIRKGKK